MLHISFRPYVTNNANSSGPPTKCIPPPPPPSLWGVLFASLLGLLFLVFVLMVHSWRSVSVHYHCFYSILFFFLFFFSMTAHEEVPAFEKIYERIHLIRNTKAPKWKCAKNIYCHNWRTKFHRATTDEPRTQEFGWKQIYEILLICTYNRRERIMDKDEIGANALKIRHLPPRLSEVSEQNYMCKPKKNVCRTLKYRS